MNDRSEIKYVLDRETAGVFLGRAASRMQPDAYSGADGYLVRSLYFDTSDLDRFQEVLDGQPEKLKFRLRRYGQQGSPLFFEVKTRRIRMVEKARAHVARERVEEMLADPFADALPGALRPYGSVLARKRHYPIVAVCYDRIALEDMVGSGVRVTVDHNIRCGRAELFDREAGTDDIRVLPPGLAVLELKFARRLPRWISEAVRDLGLRPRDFSKFARGVERVHGRVHLVSELSRNLGG